MQVNTSDLSQTYSTATQEIRCRASLFGRAKLGAALVCFYCDLKVSSEVQTKSEVPTLTHMTLGQLKIVASAIPCIEGIPIVYRTSETQLRSKIYTKELWFFSSHYQAQNLK